MSDKVVALNGAFNGEKEVRQGCVDTVHEVLDRAESGDVIGAMIVSLHHDGTCSWHYGGSVGGFAMIGAIEMARHDLAKLVAGEED